MSDTTCACGEPLHYSNDHFRQATQRIIDQKGELQKVSVVGLGSWLVPRHYIALHGFKGHQLPELAARYGFEKVG